MNSISRFLKVAAIVTLISSSAQAATVLYSTPALRTYPTNQTLYCDIFNLGAKPFDVTIEIYGLSGNLISSYGPSPLAAGTGNAIPDASTGAYCKFITSGSKKYVRAVAVYDNGLDYTLGIPAR